MNEFEELVRRLRVIKMEMSKCDVTTEEGDSDWWNCLIIHDEIIDELRQLNI